MPPYKDRFVTDAGAIYPDLSAFEAFKTMHWTGSQVSGFQFPAANKSHFHNALRLADVIIDETWPHGQTQTTIANHYQLPGLTIGQTFLVGGDDPAVGSSGWALVSHGVGEKLFTVDSTGTVVPQIASSVTLQGNGNWVLTIAPGKRFSDGSSVTAADVAASLMRTNAALSAAQSSIGTLTMTATDSTTITISTTTSTPVMNSVLAEWWAVVYKTNSTGGRVFSGPYAIENFYSSPAPGGMNLIPNPYYTNANQRQPINIRRYSSGPAVVTALESGEIDMGFNLPPNAVAQLNWRHGVSVKSFPVGYQYMMFFNTQRAWASDVNVRRAVSLAIDRLQLALATAPPGISSTTVSEAVATGAFSARTPWGAAHSPIPTDTTEAARLLDAAGWVIPSGQTYRVKAGVQLDLDLVYYTFRADLVTMAPLIQAQLQALGINAVARVNDNGDYVTEYGSDWDMLMWAQHTLPAGDPNWFLETFFRTRAPVVGNWTAQNFAQHSSSAIDTALDILAAAAPGSARATAAAAAHTAILNEYPATFLTSPIWHVGVNNRMQSYEPWGSDYYVVKANMPASDWPTAFTSGRVYTLDGTMDANGPPTGGTDWYESRVAEPDGFLSDLIAVTHPTGTNYAPSGLHYLRHAATGTTNVVTAADCTNPNAALAVHAATCESLAAGTSDVGLTSLLNGVRDGAVITAASPSSPSPPAAAETSNTGLLVLVVILAIVSVVMFAATIFFFKKSTEVASAKVDMGKGTEMQSSNAA